MQAGTRCFLFTGFCWYASERCYLREQTLFHTPYGFLSSEVAYPCAEGRLFTRTRRSAAKQNMPPTQSLESCGVKLDSSRRKSDSELLKKDRRVHFADSVGLSLVSVVYLPTPAPKGRLPSRRWSSTKEEEGRLWNFTQPLKRRDFDERLYGLNISLETIVLRDFGVYGTVKVRNLAFHKKVTVRFTIDGWSSYHDVVGHYVEGSHTGFTDTFSFEIAVPTTLIKDCKLEFAICYKVLGVEFWDNNSGDNYRILRYSPSNRWKYKLYNNLDHYSQNRYVGLRF